MAMLVWRRYIECYGGRWFELIIVIPFHFSFVVALVMENTSGYQHGYLIPTPQEWMNTQYVPRATAEESERTVEDGDVQQGRIFWLPSKDDLPKGTVRRVRGKGAIEEGIYCHPVVIVSRPVENGNLVQFQLVSIATLRSFVVADFAQITSLQGKRLDQLYNKSTEFHASRRSWYLPIAPTPEHPDANSKKTKKRFPTLEIAGDAALRSESYVNIRYIYEIEWSYLKVYENPDMPEVQRFRFERESLIRLLAKSKLLTQYEPGPQAMKRSQSVPLSAMREQGRNIHHGSWDSQPQQPLAGAPMAIAPFTTDYIQRDFCLQEAEGYPILGERPDIPPEAGRTPTSRGLNMDGLWCQLDQILNQVSAGMKDIHIMKPSSIHKRRHPLTQCWVDMKGVLAVLIASTM